MLTPHHTSAPHCCCTTPSPPPLPPQVKLGDHVTINEPKTNEAGEEVPDLYVARLDEIVYTVTGKRRITVQWLYRIQDTNLAEPVKVVGGATRRRGTQHADDVSLLQNPRDCLCCWLLLGRAQRQPSIIRIQCMPPSFSCAAMLFATDACAVVCCQGGQPLMVLPVGGDDFASQRVWLCGSAEDNRRYCHGYDIDCIIE